MDTLESIDLSVQKGTVMYMISTLNKNRNMHACEIIEMGNVRFEHFENRLRMVCYVQIYDVDDLIDFVRIVFSLSLSVLFLLFWIE